MTPDIRSQKPVPKQPAIYVRATKDRVQPTRVGVILIAVTNASGVRRKLGVDRWNGAFLSFVGSVKGLCGGGRANHFAWDAVCLVFDAITLEDFGTNFGALARIGTADFAQDNDANTFDYIAGAALGVDEIDALERAEQALSDAKLRGHSIMVRTEVAPLTNAHVDLMSDLALAVPREELFVVYQPKVNVRQRAVSSAEALIRWQHPLLGLVMPDAFIGLADQCGEMRAITLWTLRRVIDDQQQLAECGHRLRIFVNISGGLLTDRIFIDAACAMISESGVAIGFEITETAVIRYPELAIANLERCTAIGITIAIDDYGSGLSSLSYLKRLPATELKIDKMFIMHLTSSHRDPLIVRSTIDLAHALDMEVTAEGVETPAALALLTVMGCEMVQGYLICLPVKLPDFIQYLDEYQFEALQISAEPTVHRPASFWKRA